MTIPTNSIMLADYQDLEGLIKSVRVLLPTAINNCNDPLTAERLYGLMVSIDKHLES
jgi:hypothetical protein